jgi:hypothetical protein
MQPGEIVTVLLKVSELDAPINGVQAIIQYDHGVLDLEAVVAGDGAGSPWDSALVLLDEIAPGVVIPGFAIFGGTETDAAVGRIQFTVLAYDAPAATDVEILAEVDPYVTKLTEASGATTIIPYLDGPIVIAHAGDGDADGDIDLVDHGALVPCLTGPGPTDLGTDCCWFDFDRDNDVDLGDFAEFAELFSGS